MGFAQYCHSTDIQHSIDVTTVTRNTLTRGQLSMNRENPVSVSGENWRCNRTDAVDSDPSLNFTV
jgi:hypothetical protein